ncbi:cytochrome P450, partial [Mycena latifolia]
IAGEVIMSIAYGIEVLPAGDPYILLAEQAVRTGNIAAIPGRYLVDWIPLLKHVPDWVPGVGFKRQAKEARKVARALNDVPFAETKRQLASGIAPYSFTAESLHRLSESGNTYYEEDTIKGTAASMYIAGSHTTVTTLSNFFLAMLANPGAQKNAQREIDAVIGQRRLPDFGDQAALPYVSALVKEVLRWKTIAPLSIPHFLAVEDEYHGYRLPAGSVVFGNTWAIQHDEVMYPDPHAFKPERFLSNGKRNPDVPDPQIAFGYGRRICPAHHMATSSVWITIASILATFEITKAIGDDGHVIEPSFKYDSGLVSAPLLFECSIRPRSRDTEVLIEAVGNDTQRET